MTDDVLRTYRDAIGRGDVASLTAVFAEDVQLRVPLFNEPVQGRQPVAEILSVLVGVADSVDLGEAFTGPQGVMPLP
jgi:ketosteroid isomerase-like protein